MNTIARRQRILQELQEKGNTTPLETVMEQIAQRDYADMNREVAPLRQAEDAVVVDTSELNLEESIDAVYQVIREKLGEE